MMDEIDFELCLNVDQVQITQTPTFNREKRKQYPVQNTTTNSTNNTTTTTRIRTHDELGDSTADDSAITPLPPAKRARISGSEVSNQTQPTNMNAGHQGTGALVDSSPLFGHYTGFFNFESYQQCPIAVPRRAVSEEMDIDMMYMGSETETEAETEPAPERFNGQCPIHSFGSWSNGSGSFGGGLGSFSSQRNNSGSMFAIYEDPVDMDMEIEGVFCGEDWYSSPDEDKENVENGYEQGSILQETDPNSVTVSFMSYDVE